MLLPCARLRVAARRFHLQRLHLLGAARRARPRSEL